MSLHVHFHACQTCRKVFTCAGESCNDVDLCYECLRAELDALNGAIAPLLARLGDDYRGWVMPTVLEIIDERDRYKVALNEIANNYNCDPRAEAREALTPFQKSGSM